MSGRAASVFFAVLGCGSIAFAVACASAPTVVVWEKPGATQADVDIAKRACLAELEAPDSPGVNRSRLEADATGACFVRCMRDRGFTWRTEKAGAAGHASPPPADQDPLPLPGDSTTSGCLSTGRGGDGV